MVVNHVEKLCEFLISCAFQRCRLLDDLCRLSVSLKPTPPLVLISVSDTGFHSTLEEFQELKYQNDPVLAGNWDGVLCIATTGEFHRTYFSSIQWLGDKGISDKEVHHFKFDLKDVSSRRLMRLPSVTKNGAKFSGTEVSLSTYEEIDGLVKMISHFIQKMLLLKASKIAVELIVESGDGAKSIVLQKACSDLAVNAANIDNLKLGLEDYVFKHGNRLVEPCHSCFSTRKDLKVGTGIACSRGNQSSLAEVIEVVIIISDISMSDQASCYRINGKRTEVLYFQDFSPCSVSQPALEALTSIEWKNYGLVLKSVGDQDGVTLFEWENLPPCSHIDIVLHRYHKQAILWPRKQSNRIDTSLTRKAIKLALTDLKKRNAGILLSERAVKICSYAPDLAKTISGLIMSSHDLSFQRECYSLLGLHSVENEKDVIEKCIKDKIISVIEITDTSHWGKREASSLFEDGDAEQEANGPDEEYEGSEYIDTLATDSEDTIQSEAHSSRVTKRSKNTRTAPTWMENYVV